MGTVSGPRPSSGMLMTPTCTSDRNVSRSCVVIASIGVLPPDLHLGAAASGAVRIAGSRPARHAAAGGEADVLPPALRGTLGVSRCPCIANVLLVCRRDCAPTKACYQEHGHEQAAVHDCLAPPAAKTECGSIGHVKPHPRRPRGRVRLGRIPAALDRLGETD